MARREQVGVDPEGREVAAAALGLLLVAHADPDVGVDRVGARGGGARVVGQLRRRAPPRAGSRRGAATTQLDPGQLAGDRQRAGDVVAVADVGEAQAVELAEALAQGEQVGERLAGVVKRGQRVDHRHLGPGGQLGDVLVGAGADHDRVEVAREDAAVSPIDSPRESCSSSPRRTIGVAPSSATPTSKEIRVRVEGFSKTSATLRPASASAPAPLPPAGFQLERRVEQLAELERAQLFACEEVFASSRKY